MPGLKPTLANYDLDFLTRIARRWGVEISQRDVDSARADLVARMIDAELFTKLLANMDEATRKAWSNLVQKGGKIPLAEFSRTHGEIRDFGPARREREEPDLHPVSASESLWYSGLVGRAFLKLTGEPIEYIYIPEELLLFTSAQDRQPEMTTIRPAVNQKPKYIQHADALLPDHLTDMLAVLRMQRDIPGDVMQTWGIPLHFLQQLLKVTGLVDAALQPIPDALKTFFASDRGLVHAQLYQAWLDSREINELRMLPGLVFEGTWQNDPILPRKLLTGLLAGLETGTWWSISSLLAAVKDTRPDFQRPAGDYDSWFIREENSSTYLGGFENWDRVEGALLAFLLSGPLHWLGIVNLAQAGSDGKFTAFQLSDTMMPLLTGLTPETGLAENREIKIRDVRHIIIPNYTPRVLRYQVGRFCELVNINPKESLYAITTDSLKTAAEQGLQINQLLQLLEKENNTGIPESLRKLADRWNRRGREAIISKAILLRFSDESACAEFLKHAAGRFTLEELNPRTVLITARQQDGVIKVLNELGILVEIQADV